MLDLTAGPLELRSTAAARRLSEGMLDSLLQLNREFLALCAEQAAVPPAHPTLRQIAELWRALDERGRRRAAGCPFLLLDAGFADPERWQHGGALQVADSARLSAPPFFSVPRARGIARMVFVFAWSLVLTQRSGARLVLGIHPHCAQALAEFTVPQVHELAEQHCGWLRPRWVLRSEIWRELLLAAADGDAPALERARMHGVQLLAAEVWRVSLARRAAVAGRAGAAATPASASR